jgi:hypothetical protein
MMETERVSGLIAQVVFVVYLNLISEIMATFHRDSKKEISFELGCLWSSGQSSWPQIQRSGFDSRHYQIF